MSHPDDHRRSHARGLALGAGLPSAWAASALAHEERHLRALGSSPHARRPAGFATRLSKAAACLVARGVRHAQRVATLSARLPRAREERRPPEPCQ